MKRSLDNRYRVLKCVYVSDDGYDGSLEESHALDIAKELSDRRKKKSKRKFRAKLDTWLV